MRRGFSIFPAAEGQSSERVWRGPSLPDLLVRWPPAGWAGAACPAGQVVTRGARVVVVLDAVYAYPMGVELWIRFVTSPRLSQPLKRSLNMGVSFVEQMRRHAPDLSADDLPPEVRAHVEAMGFGQEQLPRISVLRGAGEELPLQGVMTETEVGPSLVEVGHVQAGPSADVILAWLNPLPEETAELTLSVSWPEAGLPEGRVPLDVHELRARAPSAQKLLDIDMVAEMHEHLAEMDEAMADLYPPDHPSADPTQ